MKRAQQDQEKKREDDQRLMKIGREWHQEQLAQTLSGPHGNIVSGVVSVLEQLNMDSAGKLLACIESVNWNTIDCNTRFVVLHEVNERIGRVRENAGMAVISDPLPPTLNVFFTIKQMLFPNSPVNAAGS